jgi:hypothetical protein
MLTQCSPLLRAERREGVWRLSGVDPVYLRDEIAPVIPGQTVAIDPGALKSFRPSYRFLCYCFASGAEYAAFNFQPPLLRHLIFFTFPLFYQFV